MSIEEVQAIWKIADAVCFDVDSTVIQEEGIDELAKFCSKGETVAEITRQAMGGTTGFREALSVRLDIIRPNMTQIQEFVHMRPARLSPGIKKLVKCLHDRTVPVYLISGGFRSLIAPVALQLDIPLENVFANRLKFYFDGEYGGFDENEPTSSNGGKKRVIEILKERYNYDNIVMIGDGVTDLEACPPATAFIGYGGNIVREHVKRNASWYVTDFQELIDAL